MKNKFKVMGIIALTVLLVFSLVTCTDNGSTGGGGDKCKCNNPCLVVNCSCADCPGGIVDPGCECADPCIIADCECTDCPGGIIDPGCECADPCTITDCDCADCPGGIVDPGCECADPCIIADCDCADCPGGIVDPGCECADPCTIVDCDCADCPGNNNECEHIFSTIPATCTSSSIPGTCTREGCEVTNLEAVVPALNHTFSTIPATCITASIPGICTREGCDVTNPEAVVPALNHSFSATIPATCITASIPGICTREGCEVTNPEAEPALGHDHVSSLICKRSGCDHQYALGDTGPAGGIIFYKDENGFKLYQGTNNDIASDTYTTAYYLEVWTGNEADYAPWSVPEVDVPAVIQLQGHDTALPEQWIGYGRRNTKIIVAAISGQSGRAAQLCDDARHSNLDDWFLPSVDEMNALVQSKIITTGGYYWTSTKRNSRDVWIQHFNGWDMTSDQGSYRGVRAVRAF